MVTAIEIPEWGGLVLLQDLSGADRDAVVRSECPQAMFAVRSLVDQSGHRLFADSDLPNVAAKCAAAIFRITDAGYERNGLAADSIDNLIEWLESPEGSERRAYFSIARELHMTVSQLLREAPSLEIAEWFAVSQIEAEERRNASYDEPAVPRTMGPHNA